MAELHPQNEPVPVTPETVETVVVTVPVNRPRKVYAGMWGPPEIGAVAAGALALVAVAMIYFFWVTPSNRELVSNRSEADRLEGELVSAKSKYGQITNTQTKVSELVSSVDDFETQYLPLPANGQSALYQRLNGLIGAYDLVNTSGPDYAPLETVDQNVNQQSDEEKGRAKFRSLYPGVYVSTTLEGSYQNLRRFIRDIETGREFIVISAIELAPSEGEKQKDQTKPDQTQNAAANTAVPIRPAFGAANTRAFSPAYGQPGAYTQPAVKPSAKGKMHGETVSLHIGLAAYFRRPGFVPPAAQQ
ncbi:MAG: hypothetical protein ABJB40_08390 [Acidobacteriota bacterium]